jgi:hypothetical protein
MRKLFIFFLCVFVSEFASSQAVNFQLGKVTYADLEMKTYPADTSAGAVVLTEMGHAYISDDQDLVFEYYAKIKILNKNGLSEGDFAVPIVHGDGALLLVAGSTFNLEGASMKETKMVPDKYFTENHGNTDLVKFAMPNIHEGSVIEIKYRTKSPYLWNFHTWEFQSEIPKIKSEFWALMPGNWIYNIILRGFQPLAANESSLVKSCFDMGDGRKSDCSLAHYVMENIPAFKEEEFMTAKKNFLSAIYFELSEVRHFTGLVDKKTKEWKDVDEELAQNENFGKQIKKARNLYEDQIKMLIANESDDLVKAKAIYDLIKQSYTWDDYYGMFAELGVKRAFETHTGNSADINLSLVGALQSAGLNALPVILSTRSNGVVSEINSVITEFDYVVASVEVRGVSYLLDATNTFNPFGFLPMRCQNGKGRLMNQTSSWISLRGKDKLKTWQSMDLTLRDDGTLQGKYTITSYGFDALEKRIQLKAAGREEYLKNLKRQLGNIDVSNYAVENELNLEKPFLEKMDIKVELENVSGASTIFFSPMITGKIEENPFKSSERLYPVDYGAPVENVFFLSLAYPSGMSIDEVPKNQALALQQNAGRYTFTITPSENKLSILSSLNLAKPVYSSQEYHDLKEMYSRIIQIHQSQIVLKKR